MQQDNNPGFANLISSLSSFTFQTIHSTPSSIPSSTPPIQSPPITSNTMTFSAADARAEWKKVNLDGFPVFSGEPTDMPGISWLQQIKLNLQLFVDNELYVPYIFFTIIVFKTNGKAATWIRSQPEFNTFFSNLPLATPALQERFCEKFLAKYPFHQDQDPGLKALRDLENISQGVGESLDSYFQRVVNIQMDLGTTDISANAPIEQIISAGTQTMLVTNFVKGLQDKRLMKIAISNNAVTLSLKDSFHVINTSKKNMDIQDSLEVENQTKFIQKSIKDLNINDSQLKTLFSSMDTKNFNPKKTPTPPIQPYQNSNFQGNYNPNFNNNWRPNNSSNNGAMSGNGYNGGNGYNRGNPSNPNPTSPPVNNQGNANNGGFNRDRANALRPEILSEIQEASFPDPSTSRNPIVNGSASYEFAKKPLCFGYGEYGHYKNECTEPGKLAAWEQAVLRKVILPRTTTINSNLSYIAVGNWDQEASYKYYVEHNPGPVP